MKKVHASLLAFSLMIGFAGFGLSSCGPTVRQERTDHYVSSQVEGDKAKINLEEVQKAFWDTKGKDFNAWMGAFEKRVNEIYDKEDVVSIDATRKTGKLEITGYIDNKKDAGYQAGEEKLFTIEQTGDVTDNNLPYKISDHGGTPYYEGHHSILGSPIVQMLVLSHLMGGWGGRYSTPYDRTVIIRDHRDSFRNSPAYSAQRSSNQDFNTRFKQRSGGGMASSKGFGGSSVSSESSSKRSWTGFGNSNSSQNKPSFGSGWGGRRSTGFGSSRGWGGRRR
jgi:hypothetical protein